jgi:acyl-CoA synthetase (AMP-forming)/AMP-acid ligase II
MGNSAEYLAGFYGTLLAGGVVVPLSERLEATRLERVLEDSGASIVLTTPFAAERRPMFGGRRVEQVNLADSPADLTQLAAAAGVGWDSPAMILYTSGSSGRPKGVLLSHGNLLANTQSILEYLPIRPTDRALALLPFCHAYGNSVVQTHLLSGATLIVDGSATFPNTIVDAMDCHRVSSFAAVPELYYALMSCSELGRRPLPSLRYMTVAGGALRPDAAREVADLISPASFFVMYGQTEATARLAYLPCEQLRRRPNSIGKPIPGVELRVQDSEGRALPCGEVGELCARGSNVMLGYWKNDEATARVLENGWLRTGDLATVDEDGFFYVEGRRNDQVKIRGMLVTPGAIADALSRRLPGCRVVIVPFALNNIKRLALFAAPRQRVPNLLGRIEKVCQDTLPRHELPSYIEIVDRLPMTDSFKIDRHSLSQRATRRAPERTRSATAHDTVTLRVFREAG